MLDRSIIFQHGKKLVLFLGRVFGVPRAFFTWTAVLGKILTLDNLRKKNIIVINRCCLCKADGDTIDHLLLNYEIARSLWYAIFNRFGLSWVMPSKVEGLFAYWWSGGCSRSAVVWKIVTLCLV
jgi:hypothetical protein